MGWSSPIVIGELISGSAFLIAFVVIETRVPVPMFRLDLFGIRSFTSGILSSFLSALARGGLMFTLIIWLQGIWLPLHGYDFKVTPLWAGIYMLPLTAGMLLAGPLSGILSDRFGTRPFATGGMLVSAASFVLLELLPIDFSYPVFALILLLFGLGMGAFVSPNRARVMNSLPPADRGAGSGMNSTVQNSAMVLSIGIFFSLMISGLAKELPNRMAKELMAHGVPSSIAREVAREPPVFILFAAFLGFNPIQELVGPKVLSQLSKADAAALVSREFFPEGRFRAIPIGPA